MVWKSRRGAESDRRWPRIIGRIVPGLIIGGVLLSRAGRRVLAGLYRRHIRALVADPGSGSPWTAVMMTPADRIADRATLTVPTDDGASSPSFHSLLGSAQQAGPRGSGGDGPSPGDPSVAELIQSEARDRPLDDGGGTSPNASERVQIADSEDVASEPGPPPSGIPSAEPATPFDGYAILEERPHESPRGQPRDWAAEGDAAGSDRADSVPADGSTVCPADYPIKGNGRSGIYHLPGSFAYARTVPSICFRTAGAAERAGFRAIGSRRT